MSKNCRRLAFNVDAIFQKSFPRVQSVLKGKKLVGHFSKNHLNTPLLRITAERVKCTVFNNHFFHFRSQTKRQTTEKFTLLPSIFMTGVHPPSPHPKSPMWQRTEINLESRRRVINWVTFNLYKMIFFEIFFHIWLSNKNECCLQSSATTV